MADLVSKEAANYRATSSTTRHCTSCVYVLEHGEQPSTCKRVAGTVDGSHVCDLFEPQKSDRFHLALELEVRSLRRRKAA